MNSGKFPTRTVVSMRSYRHHEQRKNHHARHQERHRESGYAHSTSRRSRTRPAGLGLRTRATPGRTGRHRAHRGTLGSRAQFAQKYLERGYQVDSPSLYIVDLSAPFAAGHRKSSARTLHNSLVEKPLPWFTSRNRIPCGMNRRDGASPAAGYFRASRCNPQHRYGRFPVTDPTASAGFHRA